MYIAFTTRLLCNTLPHYGKSEVDSEAEAIRAKKNRQANLRCYNLHLSYNIFPHHLE
jgi:hypothetical protein